MGEMHTTDLSKAPFQWTLEQPVQTIVFPRHPDTFDEIARNLQALGHSIEVVPFEHSGERLFGCLERVKFNGQHCIAKYIGPESSELFEIAARGIQQERDGLVLGKGLTTPIIAEIRVDDRVVAVFRGFTEGESLRDSIDQGKVSVSDARASVQELVEKLTSSGLYLWDCNSANVWRRPDGAVILLEGQCLFPSEADHATLLAKNTEIANVMFPPA
jgi:hypothetical protein